MLKQMIKNSYWIRRLYFYLKWELPTKLFGDYFMIKRKFFKKFGFYPNLKNPQTMAEKIQWMKLYDRKDFNTFVADKLLVRDFYKEKFGEKYVVPLLCIYQSWRDISLESLPNEPFIIKANTGSGTWKIVRNKSEIDIRLLKRECRLWTSCNHYYTTQEWQYKNIKPCLIVEKLLVDKNGKIPRDYKLHYINGKLQFIYCVIDREDDAYRAIFSPQWELLPFQWVSVKNHKPLRLQCNEPKPINFDKMVEFGNEIAKEFKYYVRVDFYEIEGNLYFSEITMHHGSGMNRFYPPEAEKEYSEKICIPRT